MTNLKLNPNPHPNLFLEIKILSAQSLRNNHSYFSCCFPFLISSNLKPFATLTKLPLGGGNRPRKVYESRIGDEAGVGNVPAWGDGDKFQIPIDTDFFSSSYKYSVYLELYTDRRILGPERVGWCLIPASDIIGFGFLRPGSVRYLSYRIRERDGSRGHGAVDIAVKLEGFGGGTDSLSVSIPDKTWVLDTCQTVLGVPVL